MMHTANTGERYGAGRLLMSASLVSLLLCGPGVADTAPDFTVVCALGDSLTATPAERGPNHAEQTTARLGVTLNNFAASGATTADLLAQNQHTDAVEAGTTFAFLWIGGNDLLSNVVDFVLGDDAFIDVAVANWAVAADALQAGGADVISANLSDFSTLPVAYTEGFEFAHATLQEMTLLFNEKLQQAADERGIPVVDVYGMIEELQSSNPTICGTPLGLAPNMGAPTDLYFDEIHPSSYGMGLVTNAFIEAMNTEFGTALEPLSLVELGALAGVDCSGVAEDDADGDGVTDDLDNCPDVSNADQADRDHDGTGDACDACPDDPNKTEPGACGCGLPDDDTDGDGTLDCFDACPDDPAKIEPGICGCGLSDDDTDGDGTLDCLDDCPNDPDKTAPGVCGCGQADTDADEDGVADCVDNCPDDPNADQADADGDGVGDACEPPPAPSGLCGTGIVCLLPITFLGLLAARFVGALSPNRRRR